MCKNSPGGHTNSMKKNFFICGLTGWCMEIIFTSLHSLQRKDYRMMGQTSVWMFPIYGLAAFIAPIYHFIRKLPLLFRGGIYTIAIFGCEYASGCLLKHLHICPWDYSKAKLNIRGVIRLDYAPFWMIAGLIFEKLLKCNEPCD